MKELALVDADIVIEHMWEDVAGYFKFSIGNGKDKHVHREVAERMLGRPLFPQEVVHHINYNKKDNRRENLYVCKDQAEHATIHARQDIINDGFDPDKFHYCTYHKRYEEKTKFSTRPSSWCGLHNMCREATNEYRRLNGYTKSTFDWRDSLNQQFRRAQKKGICSPLKEGRGR